MVHFYSHSGSPSHPCGIPIAAVSISGKSESRASILLFISLFGEMVFRKYLMMQRSK